MDSRFQVPVLDSVFLFSSSWLLISSFEQVSGFLELNSGSKS